MSEEKLKELERSHYSLRSLLQIVAICGMILSWTLFLYFGRQLGMVRAQNEELVGYIQEYNRSFVPQAELVRTNLQEFARAHPSVAPLLQKYYTTNTIPPRPAQ